MHNKQVKPKTNRRLKNQQVWFSQWSCCLHYATCVQQKWLVPAQYGFHVRLRLPVLPFYETQKSQVFLYFAAEAWNLANPNVDCCRYKTRPFVPILSQMNPIHVFTPHLFNMSFNNHHPPTPTYLNIFIRHDIRPNLLYVFLIFGLDGPGIEFRWVDIFRAGVLIET